MEKFEYTSLWERTLGIKNSGRYSEEIENLRTAFFNFRKNVSHLVSKIASAVPELTQHEISHLDALWDTASLIKGNKLPITPLEGFILGGAILLHDSALCFEAYENGLVGLRNTVQWKDAFADLLDKQPNTSKEELEHTANFSTLRELHAIQAKSLLGRSWEDPDTHQRIFLLEDQTLRKHFGKLIGEIASSHHWDIESLAIRFANQQNTIADYPREWRIDPVKIACILRCADATHIDGLRAPDFLHALLKRNGVSFNHWQAQNRLAKVDIDQSDPKNETLLFTSTFDFSESEADSWFVAYDAIYLVDKEIKSSNELLTSRNSEQSFQIKKVKGIESPEQLSRYVRAVDWQPCAAQVHVGNIEKLVHQLGGEMLYGKGSDLFSIVCRELIQNARDAIVARFNIESLFEGKIIIKVEQSKNGTWLIIEDNGVGMSERVLTGPLLDFGTSFWTSSLIRSEFPGLRSSKFKSIGKFGIGFYSVFMIADEVYVTSRNWNEGASKVNELKFKNGFTLRPILKRGLTEKFSSSSSTIIKLKIKDGLIPKDLKFEIQSRRVGQSNFKIDLPTYLSAHCAGLDASVYFVNEDGQSDLIHQNIKDTHFNKDAWLKTISFSEFNHNIESENYIADNLSRLEFIYDDDQIIGLAAISTKTSMNLDYLSISTVGGLANTIHGRDGQYYIGFLDYEPNSAKREITSFPKNEEKIKEWAKHQLTVLSALNLKDEEKYNVASSLCFFKTDPTSIAKILVVLNGVYQFHSFSALAHISLIHEIMFLETDYGGHIEVYHNITEIPSYVLIKPLSQGSFLSLILSDENVPIENYSILDCLYRAILKEGLKPILKKIKNIAVDRFNRPIHAITLSSSGLNDFAFKSA